MISCAKTRVPLQLARAWLALSCGAAAPLAAAEAYVELAVGANASQDVLVASNSDDRASICDEYINPRALEVPSCTATDRGTGDGWFAPFGSGAGFSAEMAFGLRLSERYRIAAAYGHDRTNFHQTVSSTDASGVDFDKIANELALGEETLGSARSHQLFLIGMLEWPNRSPWTPYAGVGFGVAWTRMGFSWLWARSPDPNDIATGIGQPNAAEIRRNLAGTESIGHRTMRDATTGFVFLAGVEREVSDFLSVGLRAQWKRFEDFESKAYQGDLLRSHAPNLRLDGSEPVSAWSRTKDTDRFSAMITIRRTLR